MHSEHLTAREPDGLVRGEGGTTTLDSWKGRLSRDLHAVHRGRRGRSRRAAPGRPLRARGGSHGIVAFGLAGEVLKLSADERRQLTESIVDEIGGAVPVFVGVGAPSSRASIELARHAEAAGASCVVVPAPMSGAVGDDALVDYFVRIAASVVASGDDPGRSRLPGRRARRRDRAADRRERAENVRLVKLEAGPAEMSHWIERLGGDFAIWGGDGGMYLLDCVRIGAAGIIPGVDLIDLLVRVYEAEARGDSAARRRAPPRDPADARLRDAALDRPLQRLRQARPRPARRARARWPALARRARSARRPGRCSSGISPAFSSRRAVSVSADGPLRRRRGAARAAAAEPAALDASRRRDRLRPDRRRRGVPVLRGDRQPLRRQPDGRARDGAGARDARHGQHPAREAHRGLPGRGLGHPERDRAGGAAARGQGRAACCTTSTSSGS